MGSDGRILSQGPISEVVKLDQDLANTLKIDDDPNKVDDKLEESNDLTKPSSNGKLIVAEEIDQGRVGWSPSGCQLVLVMHAYSSDLVL
jgi:hypothetical protein